MEVFFVYGLVILFFILVPIFVVVVLSTHPYTEPSQIAAAGKTATTQASSSTVESKIAYGVLAAILMGLCMIAVLSERSSHTAKRELAASAP
jgi:uncharacterized membrane protein